MCVQLMLIKLHSMIDMEMKEKLDVIFFIVFSSIGLELPRSSIKKPLVYNQLPKLHLLCCVVLCICGLGVFLRPGVSVSNYPTTQPSYKPVTHGE